MEKFLSLFLSLAIFLGVSSVSIPTVYAEETTQAQEMQQDALWSYAETEYDGTAGVAITAYNGSAADVCVPSTITLDGKQLPVLKLGDGIFKDNAGINSVTLGSGIKVIGENAFSGASGLICIVTDEELEEIGSGAFSGCSSFNSVILYDGIKKIGDNAFDGCGSLTIYCNEGTVGYEYAQNNGITVEILNPDAIPETVTEDGVTYYVLNGEAMMICYENNSRVVVKPYVKGNPVTIINSNFKDEYRDAVTEVYLPDTIKIIPENIKFSSTTVLFCSRESTAYKFAEEHNIPHIALEYGKFPQVIKDGSVTYYTINNEYAFVKECDKDASGIISIPEKINSLPVTGIFTRAFYQCGSVTQVILPATVTNIYSQAFEYCHKLESVNIPDGTEIIGEAAFRYCSSLKNITIPNSVRRIESDAFCGTRLQSVDLPQKTEFIGESAFASTNLSEVAVPSRAVIENYAFKVSCLSRVYIPADAETVWFNAFYGFYGNTQEIVFYVYANSPAQQSCEKNHVIYHVIDSGDAEPYEYDDTVLIYDDYGEVVSSYSAKYLIHNNEATVLSVTGADTYYISEYADGVPVTAISRDAFASNRYVRKIYLPNSIKYIAKEAFKGCELLEEVNIPEGISVIENGTFRGCKSLKSIELPDSLREIGDEAFLECGIENITFPNNLEKIGREAFEYSGLKKLDYPIADVGIWAFQSCENLAEVNIPSGVTVLPERVFSSCIQLKFVYIPDSVTDFGNYIFFGCPRVILITESSSIQSASVLYANEYGIMFCPEQYEDKIRTYDYTYEGINYYLVDSWYSEYRCDAIVLPGDYQFTGKLTIPKKINTEYGTFTVARIGDLAFADTNLPGIELPETLSVIGGMAFRGCQQLTEINIPNHVKIIGATALAAQGLSGTLVYPKCKVGMSVFGTTNYDIVYVPEGVTVLPKYVFCYTHKLEEVTLPESLQKIESLSFYDTAVKNLVIPGNTVIDKEAFFGLNGLEKLVLSEGITRLEDNFHGCGELKFVYLPKSLTYIDYNAFTNCPKAVFCVYENSYAHMFAKNRGLPYFILGTKKNPDIAYGAEISGKAVYSDGMPAANAAADILYDDGTLKESVKTDENGEYSFTYAEVGRYTIRITDSNGRTGSGQISVKRKNAFDVFVAGSADITVKSSWSISGRITPCDSAKITLSDTDGNVISAAQAENGNYTISNVPNGSYVIKAESENGSAVREITVYNSDVTNADITIEKLSASIEGYVEIEDRSFNRHKRNWVRVTVYNSDGIAAASCKTDDNGRYSFDNLPFGDYSIVAETTEMRPEHKHDYKRSLTLTGYAYITLSEAKLYTVDTIVLSEQKDDCTVISGKVTAKGENQSGEVILANVFRCEIARCTVGNNGKYSFSNVRDGLYFITAITKNNGMGFAMVVVRHGRVYGNTNITVYKDSRIAEHEKSMNEMPQFDNPDDAAAYKDRITAEKSFYDGLPEREKKQFSREYIEKLNKLSEYISSCRYSSHGGELSQGGLIISAEELESGDDVQLNLNIEKKAPWTIGGKGIKTDEEYMQQSVEDTKGDETIAQYYDISLTKVVGNTEKQITDVAKDTDTTGKVRVTIPIPEEYKGHRNYSFIHVHNGITTTLVDMDNDPDTVTFEIDKFSTFVLTYNDTEKDYPASITYADGKITALSKEAANIFIATYDGNKLVSVEQSKIDANIVQNFDFNENMAAFVWDNSLFPLCKKFTINNKTE